MMKKPSDNDGDEKAPPQMKSMKKKLASKGKLMSLWSMTKGKPVAC